MGQQSTLAANRPWEPLEESAESFRRECEALDVLVEDLLVELESMNARLGQKAAEVAGQQAYIEQREQQWAERQMENQDLREFFVHQNDRIAHAIEKLSMFEERLTLASGNEPAQGEMLGLLTELRDSREAEGQQRAQESQRWQEHFSQQNQQLSQALSQLAGFEIMLMQVAQAGNGTAPEIAELLTAVREQQQWLRENAAAATGASASDGQERDSQFLQQQEQLGQILEKLAAFEQQLARMAETDPSGELPAAQLAEFLSEIRSERQEFRQQAELYQAGREQDHAALESFFARQGDQLDNTLGKLSSFEELVRDLAVSVSVPPENASPQLGEFLDEIKTERDEFRQRFDQANQESARLSELVSRLADRSPPLGEGGEPISHETLLAIQLTNQKLNQELIAAQTRVTELEQTVSQQQQELYDEKLMLREQLRELRELLELRSNWDQPPAAASVAPAAPAAASPAASAAPKPAKDARAGKSKEGKEPEQSSILAQFAKLSRK